MLRITWWLSAWTIFSDTLPEISTRFCVHHAASGSGMLDRRNTWATAYDRKWNSKTVSLAGTQVAPNWKPKTTIGAVKKLKNKVLWLILLNKPFVRYIADITRLGPENYRAANLIHLKTAFEFPQAHIQNRFSDLHWKPSTPTPSVGGLPKDEARVIFYSDQRTTRSWLLHGFSDL